MSEAVLVRYATVAVPDRRQVEVPAPVRFEEFVAARAPDPWRSAWLLTGDAHKAEDLVPGRAARVLAALGLDRRRRLGRGFCTPDARHDVHRLVATQVERGEEQP